MRPERARAESCRVHAGRLVHRPGRRVSVRQTQGRQPDLRRGPGTKGHRGRGDRRRQPERRSRHGPRHARRRTAHANNRQRLHATRPEQPRPRHHPRRDHRGRRDRRIKCASDRRCRHDKSSSLPFLRNTAAANSRPAPSSRFDGWRRRRGRCRRGSIRGTAPGRASADRRHSGGRRRGTAGGPFRPAETAASAATASSAATCLQIHHLPGAGRAFDLQASRRRNGDSAPALRSADN